MPLVVAGALVLAAVNLVTWVVSLEREERETLKTELKLAHDVQMSLMPKGHPQVQGLDIAGMSVPAREVGGDFFDYSCLGGNDTKLGIPVFDVSGKGMQAAMSAVFTSGAFASEAKQSSSPAEILTRLNRSVCSHSRRGHFVAFLLVAVDQQTRSLTFANAGQTRPVLRSGGTVQSLDSVGVHFPLGMKEDSLYEERTVQLQPGDVLFLLTDGFTDAMNSQDEMFGTERIERMLTDPRLDGLSAQQMMDSIADEVRTHVGSAPQHDDMTMVVVKVVAS
jgi:sigma-B regulation protein RsbU (phosphoserine phosphatase)